MRIPTAVSTKLISALTLLLGLTLSPSVSAQFNPIQAAKDAWNKAKQQQPQQQQQGQQQGSQSGAQPASAPAPSASGSAQPSSSGTASADASQGGGGAWQPPSGAAAAPAGPPDLSKIPDISGLRLGMSLADATAVMKKLYPRGVGQLNGGPFGHQQANSVAVLRATGDFRDAAAVDLTSPPNAPVVWQISRDLVQPKVAHNVIVAGLRQKFGKETYASGPAGRPITDDSQIQKMWWVFDEQGHLMAQAKMISDSPFGCGSHYSTDGSSHTYQDFALGRDEGLSTYCTSSYVGVEATMSTNPILEDFLLSIVDLPLMVRSAKATGAWANGQDDKARQQEIQRENQAKPTL
jgi:hypothetical protein